MTITLRPIMWTHDGPVLTRTDADAFCFEVEGLPPGWNARICEFSTRWRCMEGINGNYGDWQADYDTKELALEAVVRRHPAGSITLAVPTPFDKTAAGLTWEPSLPTAPPRTAGR